MLRTDSIASGGFLQTNFFISPAEERCDRAPNERATDAECHSSVEAVPGRPQSCLHPCRAYVTESVDHGIDDILGFVTAALFHDGEADFPRGSGYRVLPDAAHDLQRLNHGYRRRDGNANEGNHHDE